MDGRQKQALVNRICAGGYYATIFNEVYFLDFRISSKDKAYLDYMYDKSHMAATEKGLQTEEEALDHFIKMGKWSRMKDHLIETKRDLIDEKKKEACSSIYNKKKMGKLKKEIKELKSEIERLLLEKHALISEGTCESYCREVVNRCKYSKIVKNVDGTNISEDLLSSQVFFRELERNIWGELLDEAKLRELARTNPWRLVWNTESDNPSRIFNIPVCDFSDEQRDLCYWSSYYDSIYEAYERPSKEIIEDDIALDGWYSNKIAEKERETAKKGLISKAGDNKEIFVPTDAASAHKVYELNDPHVREAMKKRDKTIKTAGEKTEADLVKEGGKITAGLFVAEKKGR